MSAARRKSGGLQADPHRGWIAQLPQKRGGGAGRLVIGFYLHGRYESAGGRPAGTGSRALKAWMRHGTTIPEPSSRQVGMGQGIQDGALHDCRRRVVSAKWKKIRKNRSRGQGIFHPAFGGRERAQDRCALVLGFPCGKPSAAARKLSLSKPRRRSGALKRTACRGETEWSSASSPKRQGPVRKPGRQTESNNFPCRYGRTLKDTKSSRDRGKSTTKSGWTPPDQGEWTRHSLESMCGGRDDSTRSWRAARCLAESRQL